ncbi:unnamed protein product, partial [Prorocentrum cordatum]
AAVVTGLILNPGKCSLVFAVPYSRRDACEMFRGSGIKARPYRVDTFGKYLGVYVGPKGPTVSWGAPGTKCFRRAWHIKGLSLGLCQNIITDNALAFSVFSFAGQLHQ